MQRRKGETTDIEKRILHYSLTAAAVLAGAGSLTAQSTVVTIDYDPDIVLNTNGAFQDITFASSSKFRISVSNNDRSDFHSGEAGLPTAGHSTPNTTGTGSHWIWTGYSAGIPAWTSHIRDRVININNLTASAGAINEKLYSAATIGIISQSFPASNSLAHIYNNDHGSQHTSGPFVGANENFIGVKFTDGGSTHYGWIKVSVDNEVSSITIMSAAYESTPGLEIKAGSDQSLPVELESFNANVIERGIQLNWNTASEVNNYGFEIERRMQQADGRWQKIAFVEGNGTSNSPKDYSFVDNTPNLNGMYLYRLKQIDTDGKYEYSKIVEVNVRQLPTVFDLKQNYPNPFNPTTSIKYQVPCNIKVKLSVYDLLGKEVVHLVDEEKPTGTYEVKFDGSNLPSGVYFYKIEAGNFTSLKKLMLLK